MAEETPTQATVVNPPAQEGATTPPADTTAQPSEGKTEDKNVPYDRFKEVNEEKKQLAARLAEVERLQKEAETKQLEEQQRYKELYEKEKETRETESKHLREVRQTAAFYSAIDGLGVVDKEVALVLAQEKLAKLESDEQGNLIGVEDVVKTLLQEKPYLVNKNSGAVGSPTNPTTNQSAATGTRTYTKAEISDHAFYQANKDDINKALAEGRIQ